ncbi:PolC-type DNA polymerase III [Haloplasma contractile]|uniref:DNA polymerase III PolC-type n=1 Tax=Haloplasma contractile SSD-17B TaxID=1033810 RepID=F7Q1N9_9MOLU|nr:PolC-type DNA polymerase III [Haloplasma contractile]ERJ12906.1 DNA polymerase III PolC-type protein [Haloplasma contractile SSD-17B]
MNKFNILLEQIEYNNDIEIFENCDLKTLTIDKSNGEYHFELSMPTFLKPEEALEFYYRLHATFKRYRGVNHVTYNTEVNEPVTGDLIQAYWEVVYSLLKQRSATYMALKQYTPKFLDNQIVLCIKTEKEKLHIEGEYQKAVENMYRSLGIKMKLKLVVTEDGHCSFEKIQQRHSENTETFKKQMEETQVVAKKVEQQPASNGGGGGSYQGNYNKSGNKPKRKRFTMSHEKIGYNIKGDQDKIINIPVTGEDLEYLKPEFIIEGYIFDQDIRSISGDRSIMEASVTDYSDSIMVKHFVNSNDDLEFYQSCYKKGNWIRVKANAKYDDYRNEVILFARSVEVLDVQDDHEEIIDEGYEGEKRIELHLHTTMSNMDSVTSIDKYVNRALDWGHEAIAITDHAGMYALPDLFNATEGKDIKAIYGVECNLVEDKPIIAWNEQHIDLQDATYVVFDLETTGFSINYDDIIEVAAVKIKQGQIVDEFSEFCNPHRKLSYKTTEITSITDGDVVGARDIPDVLRDFRVFCEGAILVAHNASFDMSHIEGAYKKYNLGDANNPVFDTLQYARYMYHEDMKRFNLKALSKRFRVELTQHHRAIYDARATGEVFLHILRELKEKNITYHDDINNLASIETGYKLQMPSHVTLLAKNQDGLKNLFKIVSDMHTIHFHKEPRLVRSVLEEYREHIFVGSSCVNGEVFKIAMEKSYEQLKEVASFYDYLEVQPPEVYRHLIDKSGEPKMKDYINETIKRIIKVGKELNIPVLASGDVHHLEREDRMYRQIFVRTPQTGGGFHPLASSDIDEIPSMHFRTTQEMIQDFEFLDKATKKEIVITNPRKIASQVEYIKAIKDELFTPTDDFLKDKGIPSIEVKMRELCYDMAGSLYGDPLPQIVEDRLEKELTSIIKHGFAVIYYISHMLVKKSLDDGYLVGSRGSVGSSFVATMTEITEVNPLSPHYYCPECHFTSFKMNDEEKERYGVRDDELQIQKILDESESGFDLPNESCPKCGSDLNKDGHDIPFETFLGFAGDKVPDIDLNFSGEYQPVAHAYCQEVFGFDYAFRAGTIGTVAEKTAFGYVRGYFEKQGIEKREPEIRRLAKHCEGVKRSTGQHPGGIIVVPDYMDIYDITPIQFPADNLENAFRTTHFDFHSIHDNLLKLDILGHDDPTMLHYLEKLTGKSPQDVPIDDPNVYELFNSTKSLGVEPEQILSNTGSYGVPEFGTFFVRNMLDETRPTTFAELVKISGLSHGTDVWTNNAQDLVLAKFPEYGKIDFKNVIGCRDDIMVYLMYNGLEPKLAFDIMEFVRKGKAFKQPEKWEQYVEKMREENVPEWYIWSCGQIKYMFPKAHATAYVLMAIRIAWFKVNMPLHYYAAYFSKRASYYDVHTMVQGSEGIRRKISEINEKGFSASATEKSLVTVLELALEMCERGYRFRRVDIDESDATEFLIDEEQKALIIPFIAIDGLGGNVAKSIVIAREEKEFISKEDLAKRTSLSKTLIEKLDELGTLDHLQESNQLSLFDFD